MTPKGLANDACPFAKILRCISSPKQDPMKKHEAFLGKSTCGGMMTAVLSLGG